MRTLSNNWINKKTKTYEGPIKDETGYVEIAYTGSFGKREKVIVSPDRVEIKFQSLLERGLNPYILP